MVFFINLKIHLNDSIRYEININIITYLIYLGNCVKVEAKITCHAESDRNICIANRLIKECLSIISFILSQLK